MSNYTSQNNVEKYTGETYPAALATYIAAYLNAVDSYIENYTQKKWKDQASADKYYDGAGGISIDIDNFVGTPTTVQTLDGDGDVENTLDSTDYMTAPYNETIKNRLILLENNRIGFWPVGNKRIKVTANFGATTAPADITLAATMLMAGIMAKYTKGGETKSESVGDVSFTYRDLDDMSKTMGVIEILNQYRTITL